MAIPPEREVTAPELGWREAYLAPGASQSRLASHRRPVENEALTSVLHGAPNLF